MTTNVSSAIRVIAEEPESGETPIAEEKFYAPPAPVSDSRIGAALGALRAHDDLIKQSDARLAALEATVQAVPHVAGVMRGILAALGARILALIGLIGCLSLAGVIAFAPTWQGLVLLGIVVVGVQLPLVIAAYHKGA